MKILHYALGMMILISGIDVMFSTTKACPRCRRALPKGPRKLPHPGFPKKEIKENPSQNNQKKNVNEQKK
jgi:hypothetical protein